MLDRALDWKVVKKVEQMTDQKVVYLVESMDHEFVVMRVGLRVVSMAAVMVDWMADALGHC